jgi:predicted PurR-regulated permease PerM
VIAIALVPLLEWLERARVPSSWPLHVPAGADRRRQRRDRVDPDPASQWVQELPDRIERIRRRWLPCSNGSPSSSNSSTRRRGSPASPRRARRRCGGDPHTTLEIIAESAPHAILQVAFALLVIFFFLAGWTRMRKRTITTRQFRTAP